ncbi:MAG: hypothetical protein HN742_16735 [Lentisphaerae bacterium]|nr:hypothetical protein [Lentisphaerota bacterium]MBT4819684.1 hypothetical protein [Lentisphaerota bacterium]MBT5606424.1 hypothetical protein [Lentisphaerota bacterium]MBT7057228.1 hypothetical protein [Lentisphaerota bacterium]MBT7843527.1 hypothetical protein [Lentisphaerota bacterium]
MKTLLILMAVTAFVAQGVHAAEGGASATSKSVLIVTQKSKYKKALVPAIATLLKERGYESKVVGTDALTDRETAGYAAIVVVVSTQGWKSRKQLPAFLKSADARTKGRIVVVTTANKPNWRAGDRGVHAITTASKISNVAATVSKVAKGLDGILSAQK